MMMVMVMSMRPERGCLYAPAFNVNSSSVVWDTLPLIPSLCQLCSQIISSHGSPINLDYKCECVGVSGKGNQTKKTNIDELC